MFLQKFLNHHAHPSPCRISFLPINRPILPERIRQFSGQMVIVRNRLSDIKNYSSRIEYEEGSIPVSEHVQEFKQQMTLQLVNEYGLYKKTAEAIM